MWKLLRNSMHYLQKSNCYVNSEINQLSGINSLRFISNRVPRPTKPQFNEERQGRILAIPIVNQLSITPLLEPHMIEDSIFIPVVTVLPSKHKPSEKECARQVVSRKKKKRARRKVKNKKSHMEKIKKNQKRIRNPIFTKDILTLVREADLFSNDPFKPNKDKTKKNTAKTVKTKKDKTKKDKTKKDKRKR